MRIEPATPADCRAIAEVHVAGWQQAYAHIFPADFLAARTVESSERYWREQTARGEPQVLVARAEQVVGFVAFGASRDAGAAPTVGEIWAIYVAPELWSKGAGRLLCAAAVERLHARQLDPVTL